ncbi:DEAD/DEAH box helicase family protein [bacterium]|nr:DEAD/DEAH box helicase family protein [bacterium]
MNSNFAFLERQWPGLLAEARRAEQLALADPRTSCFYARRTLELAMKWLYTYDRRLELPYQDKLAALVHEPSFARCSGERIVAKARFIKDSGNAAVHSGREISREAAVGVLRELFHFCFWLARSYSRAEPPPDRLQFDAALLPDPRERVRRSREQLRALQEELSERDDKLTQLVGQKELISQELLAVREELAKALAANEARPDTHDYSETETRDRFIDLLLFEAGWPLADERDREYEVQGMPNPQGKGYVDYVLWGMDGRPLALVEAKRTRVSPKQGQQQAKLYADCLEQQFGRRPLVFYTNGYEHWYWDDKRYPPRRVQGFLKRDEMELAIQRRDSLKPLGEEDINEGIAGRHYQTRAIRRVAESFETDRMRKSLLVMATGAGKTRTVIALSDLLMRCNWAKRVLFLADRRALVKQAARAFKAHLPASSPVNLLDESDGEGRVFLSTYPTMMNLIDDSVDGEKRFGPGHFDLVVIDEAHRSVYQKYRAIFDYFDSLLVGLTATPKDEVDRNTYSLFELEDGVPTDHYSLDEAVRDGYLVPPVAISVPLKFQREGIRYDELSEEAKEQWDALDWDEEDGEIPDSVDANAVNQWLFNRDTVDKVLRHLMERGIKVDGGDTLGKTIIFAKNNDHAEFIEERFNANYPHLKGQFARVITYAVKYADTLIDEFSDRRKMPQIALSVDMLDTGIDIPEVVNLVFFKLVRSKTKFWQMLGRGTRLCPDLFGPGQDKTHFQVFDYCQNLEFFSQNPQGSDGSTGESLSSKLFRSRVEITAELDGRGAGLADSELQEQERRLHDELLGELKEYVARMNPDNFIVRMQRRLVEKYQQEESWKELGSEERQELATHLAELPSELVDRDTDAKRFDLLLFRLQLSTLQHSPWYERQKQQLQKLAEILNENDMMRIPDIQKQQALVLDLLSDEWWQDVTVPMLDNVRRKLRGLMHLIQWRGRRPVYTDFEDVLGEEVVVSLPDLGEAVDREKFREKAQKFLRQHEDHIAVRKIRSSLKLNAADLDEIEKLLIAEGIASEQEINQATLDSGGFGRLVRSLVGMDRETAIEAFSAFINDVNATPNQIEMLYMIIEQYCEHGSFDARQLFASPFTDVAPRGPQEVFRDGKLDALLAVISEINEDSAA